MQLLEHIETWKYWVLSDREPCRGWSRGRITLLGDSAHPMLQYLAQSAAMALEDSLCLASELAVCEGDIENAFLRYEDRRVLRTGRLQLMSRFYGDVYHAKDVTAELRRELLRDRQPEEAWAAMAWLYDHKQQLATLPVPPAVATPETERFFSSRSGRACPLVPRSSRTHNDR